MTKHKKKVHETSCASTAVHVHGILEPGDERVGYHLEDNEHLDAMYTDTPDVQTPSVEFEMDDFWLKLDPARPQNWFLGDPDSLTAGSDVLMDPIEAMDDAKGCC